MRKIIVLIILCLSMNFVWSQNKIIDSLSIELAYQKADSLKVDTSLYLIKNLYAAKNYDKALKYIIESEKLSNSLNYHKGIAEITYYKALIYAEKNDYINAVSGYSKSKDLFNQLNDTLSVAMVNNSIGLIEIKRGNYDKGLQYSLSSIKELEKRGLKNDLKLAYSNLAEAYYKIKNYDKATPFYLKALQIQTQLQDKEGINASNLHLAKLYSFSKEHRKAIDYYEKVISSLNSKSDSARAKIYPQLGAEYLKFHDYKNATKYLTQAYGLNKRANNDAGFLTTLINLADLNLQQRRVIIAEKQLLQAGVLAKKLNNKEELLRQYELMKAIDSTNRRFDRAFVWQRRYYSLKDSLERAKAPVNSINNTPVQNLNLDLNFDKRKKPEKPIATTTINNDEELLELKKKNKKLQLFTYILLAILALVITALFLIYFKRNNNLKYTQELEEKNIKIELQNEAFLEQTKHLENVNNVKDKLFSIVSHDLKDSLSSINGFIDLMKDGSLTRQEFDNLIPELSENANNASLLLFNLLNWSKSQMQSLKPNPSLFDIQEVFEDKVKLIEQRIESKGIDLVDHSLRDFAYADRSMFEIVVQNLLANALKFSKNGDTITISNHISNGSCIISIADSGVGISKKNIEKIFKGNSFTTMGTNNEKGTGLGLSICRELVELNGGKIWVESTVNVGSTFYVQLPKSKPAE
ncbi:tetratricopeptide repeat-containing sensor histidine kinase [Postechiella marina]